MSRRLSAALVTIAMAAGSARAQDKPDAPRSDAAAEIGDQAVGGALGVASGGGVTPGGLRITGHYLYQLSSEDWFDGTASFTFGGGDAECFVDRDGSLICDHGITSGGAIEIAAGVRRMFASREGFIPFLRAAVGVSFVRFDDDDLSGFAIPLHFGGGLRASVADSVGVVVQAEAMLGVARMNRGLGVEPQLGLAVTAGAEFRLR